MIKNVINYSNGEKEYHVDLHVITTKQSLTKVMYITATTIESGYDYTVIFNGLPTPKNLKKCCEKDWVAARCIIEALKKKWKYAATHWQFDKEQWEEELESNYGEYLKSYVL